MSGAHYSGRYSSIFGRGRGIKSSDLLVAYLCEHCHEHFDGYESPNNDERAIEFFLCIAKTWHLWFEDGLVS